MPSYTGNPYNFLTPCAELDGSPTEVAALGSYRAIVKLRCAWDDRYALAGEVSPWALYQRIPGSFARCRTISIEPLTQLAGLTDESNLWNVYEEAKITLEYVWDRKSPQQVNNELWSEEIQPTAEYLTQPGSNFVWGSNTSKTIKDEEAPGILLRGLDYVLTHFNVPAIPAAALSLIGCVNNATLSALIMSGMSFGAETLLFNPPTISRRVVQGTKPQLNWTLVYRLTYKPQGWNKLWNANMTGGPGWDDIKLKSNPTGPVVKRYAPATFTGF
ncbi:MAG TPA: hypothetical protein PK867_26830 [Pirellulales bacterium]|nr:hypothetical protein [Pirellulales bacterium]